MDVLMVAAELGPQARVTPAADSIAALSKAMRQLGHQVTVALPKSAGFEAAGMLLARRLSPLVLHSGLEVTVLDGQLASGVSLVLFDSPAFTENGPMFGASGADESDAERAALLASAAAAFVRERREHKKPFDIVHLHDWPAAPAAGLIRGEGAPPTVLTIHGLSEEKTFNPAAARLLGPAVDDARARVGQRVSFLRLGMLAARAVTTVSPSYADLLGRGPLSHTVAQLAEPIVGVLDGVDYAIFNPATDPGLESRFDAEDPSNKGRCKTALLRALELELVPERPLIVIFLDGMDPQGQRALLAALPRILELDVAVVAAGKTAAATAAELARLRASFAGDLAVSPKGEGVDLRRLVAGADFVLSAQGEVPCGHVQLVAQRYGALPVAEARGGMPDAVVDADAELETGSGFLYGAGEEDALLGAVQRAVSAYATSGFSRLRRRVMRRDLSWDRPARRYEQVYRRLLGDPSVGQ